MQSFIKCNFNRRIIIEKAILTKKYPYDECLNCDTIENYSVLLSSLCNGRIKCGMFDLSKFNTQAFPPEVPRKLTVHYYCIGR